MKKNIIIAAMVAATALFFTASCAKQEPVGSETPGEGRTFSAVIEQNLTKTTITSELKVHWQNGDLININGYEYVATAKIPATKALFSPVDGEAPRSGKYLAFFPSSIMKEDGSSYLPQTQAYVPGAFNSPMYAVSETEELSFRNLCGVLHFAIKGAEKVGTITVKANENLWGSFTISEDGSAVLRGGGDNTVKLDCGENGVQLNPDNATDFYISLPAGTYSTGMEINVIGTDSTKLNVTKTTVKNITIARNTVYDLEWNFEPTVNETLAKFFKDMANDQAVLAAATDEAVGVVAQQNFFLPEIHTWENALAAIKAIDRNLAKLESEVNKGTPQWSQQKGELHFFRALLYFELFRTYGQAPTEEENIMFDRKQIFFKIDADAGEAANILPPSYVEADRVIALDKDVEITCPTKWAATALLARTYQYADSPLFGLNMGARVCKKYCDEIINNGGFSLEKYSDLWGENAFTNKELIFGVRFTTPSSAYNGLQPTSTLYSQFDGSDTRLASTISKSDKLYLIKPVANVLPIFRFADILLICAEANINIGDIATADRYVSQVQSSAGLTPVQLTSDNKFSVLLSERMKELAFEGHRFWDARRWGKAGEFFETIEGVKRTWNENYNFYPVPQN